MRALALLSTLLGIKNAFLAVRGDTMITVNADNPLIQYASSDGPGPTWSLNTTTCPEPQMTTFRSNDSLTFTFTVGVFAGGKEAPSSLTDQQGIQVSIVGSTDTGGGILDVSLDGVHTLYDCSRAVLACAVTLYTSPLGLSMGNHTLVARLMTGTSQRQTGSLSIQQLQYVVPETTSNSSHMRTVTIVIAVIGSILLLTLLAIGILLTQWRKDVRRNRRRSNPRAFFDPNDSLPDMTDRFIPQEATVNPFVTVHSVPRRTTEDDMDEDPGASAQPLMQGVSPPAAQVELPQVEEPGSPDHVAEDEELRRDWLRAHTFLVMSNPDSAVDTEPSHTVAKPSSSTTRSTAPLISPPPNDQHFVNRVAEQLANLVLAQRIQDLTDSPPSYIRRLDPEPVPLADVVRTSPTSRGHSLPRAPNSSVTGHHRVDSADPEPQSPESRALLSEQPVSPRRFGPRPMPRRNSSHPRTSQYSADYDAGQAHVYGPRSPDRPS